MTTEQRCRGKARGWLLIMASGAAAGQACEPEPVREWPTCDPDNRLTTINPRLTLDVFGNLNLYAFADGANSQLLPG